MPNNAFDSERFSALRFTVPVNANVSLLNLALGDVAEKLSVRVYGKVILNILFKL